VGERCSIVTCAASFRDRWHQSYRGGAASNDDHAFAAIVQILRPLLRMNHQTLEAACIWELGRTGLVMQAFGGIQLSVDGRGIDAGQTLAYKGVMLSGVPNLASVFGYINASWTLKADLIEFHGQERRAPGYAAEYDRQCSGAVCREFHIRLHAARSRQLAETGFEAALARKPELHPGHHQLEVDLGCQRRVGVLQSA